MEHACRAGRIKGTGVVVALGGGRCRANRRTRNGRRSGGPSGRSRSYRRVCAGCSTTGPPTGPGARPCGGRGRRRCWPRANAWLSPSAPRRREAYLWRVARGPPGRTKPNRDREPGESLWRLFVAMLRLPACDSEGILTPSRCESDTAKPRPACCPRARLALLVHLVHLVSLVVALGDGHVECADARRNQKAQAHGWKEHLLRSPPLLGGLLPETRGFRRFAQFVVFVHIRALLGRCTRRNQESSQIPYRRALPTGQPPFLKGVTRPRVAQVQSQGLDQPAADLGGGWRRVHSPVPSRQRLSRREKTTRHTPSWRGRHASSGLAGLLRHTAPTAARARLGNPHRRPGEPEPARQEPLVPPRSRWHPRSRASSPLVAVPAGGR